MWIFRYTFSVLEAYRIEQVAFGFDKAKRREKKGLVFSVDVLLGIR